MHKMLFRFIAAATVLCAAGVASAKQYPNATCTDSVTIRQIKDASFLPGCQPVVPDTVRGVGGVIVGFDPIATGFDAYIENSAGGPFQGIDFFTHSANTKAAPYSFQIGDSIVVEFAKVDLFAGDLEIDAPNGSFGSPNFIVRKVNSGNALPPFFVGTSTQLKELPTNTFFPQYVGSLIKLNQTGTSSLKVARTSLTGGLGQNNAFLVVDSTAPTDSVFVDGNKLTTFAPPAVGTPIFTVQGVGNSATRGFRIMLRDGNDIVSNTPPDVSDAYPIDDTHILVKFDRDVTTASATNTSNYSLASFGSVNSASMVTQSSVNLSITNGLNHGDLETVTVNGIVGLAAGQTMTTPESKSFVNGVLTAAEVQLANPDSLAGTPCVDRSRFAGPAGQVSLGLVGSRAVMAAICVGRWGSIYYMDDAGNPNRGGIAAFAPPAVLAVGHTYRLTGAVQEFFGETEFSNIIDATDLGAATTPLPVSIPVIVAARDTCDATNGVNDGEDYEGRLVTLQHVTTVQRFNPPPTNGFHVVDGDVANPPTTVSVADTIFIQNYNNVLDPFTAPPLGHKMTITGVLHYDSGSFRVVPANPAAIVDEGAANVGSQPLTLQFSVAPNPARSARLNFTLPHAGEVDMAIFDISGRRVATLVSGSLEAGSYSRTWDGLDSGKAAHAGMYFARLRVGSETRTLRAIHLN